MARGRHYAKLSLSNAARLSFSDLCILLFMFLSLCRLCVCVFLCSHWSLVDVPLIFFCPADHVPDWQPRVLLGMVEARSVNVKKTTTTTTTQAEYGAYLRDSSRVPRWLPFIYLKPPYAIGSVPSLSGHAIAYRWRSLPRVRRHRASKPQGSFERVLPWQIRMDQIICASLSYRRTSCFSDL